MSNSNKYHHLVERTFIEPEPNSVLKEPSGFLSDAKVPGNLATADAVLRVDLKPHRDHALVDGKAALFKDGPDLHRELAARMVLATLPHPPGREMQNVGRTAVRAADTLRPADRGEERCGVVQIGKDSDGFNQRFGQLARVHARILEVEAS